MAFPLSAFTAIVLQLFGPVVLIAILALAMRPGRAAGTWAAGPGGAAAGAALFLFAMILKLIARAAGVPEWWGEGDSGAALVRESIGIGIFASLAEETVRFAAAALLFRRASVMLDPGRTLRPVQVALLFGLGWGGVESAITGIQALLQTLAMLQQANGNPGEIPIPFFPLVGAFERFFAVLFHVALSAIAARAAGELGVRRAGRARGGAPSSAKRVIRALAFFAAAIALHAFADAVVHYHAKPATRALAFEDYPRGVRGFLFMELWFAVIAGWTFVWARRLRCARPAAAGVE